MKLLSKLISISIITCIVSLGLAFLSLAMVEGGVSNFGDMNAFGRFCTVVFTGSFITAFVGLFIKSFVGWSRK